MGRKHKALLEPLVKSCRDLLEQYIEIDDVNDMSIRFTWNGETIKLTVTNHIGDSNGTKTTD